MYYVYIVENDVNVSTIEPETEYFTIDKLPPIPNKKYQKLYADFEKEIIWYDTRDLTEEEIKQERIKEIYKEFEELDNIIKRDTEQLYKDINVTPSYKPMVDGIAKKEELRKELQTLTKVGE